MAFEEENPEGYLAAEYSIKLDEFMVLIKRGHLVLFSIF
jgi:hypothetical protein